MSKPWLLVTPASQGLGFHLAIHLLKNTRLPVVATARSDIDDVRGRLIDGTGAEKDRLEVLKVDVTGRRLPPQSVASYD